MTYSGSNVADIGLAMQKFGVYDYMVFLAMLSLCIVIGLYFAYKGKKHTAQDYLVGGRAMNTLPVAMSLIASWVSGISLLGIPTENYVYGMQYVYICVGVILCAIIAQTVYLPVFHNLQITSTYEYLERRFDKKVRIFGSVLFTIGLIVWLPVVIYVPALAFNQVTGVNVHLITPVVCIICIFYTSIGGIKAVVWTDVIQTIIMIGAMLLVAIKGTMDIGGFGLVLDRNLQSNRIELPNLDINPLSRHTLWTLAMGGSFHILQSSIVNQNMIQRYLSLPTLKDVNTALWIFVVGLCFIVCLGCYSGLLIYATFYNCDPLTTMLAREKDQLLPLLVMEVLGNYPGLPGLFIAGIFSAALSSLSTGLNSMAAVVLEDFYKTCFKKKLTDEQTYILMKSSVVVLGVICVVLVFLVEKMGAVLQLTASIGAISAGPCLSLFTMGILLPWIGAKAALIGSVSGLGLMSWLCLSAQAAIASGDIYFPEKSVSTEGCHYHFTPKLSRSMHFNNTMNANVLHTDETFMLYRLSYLWYTFVGAVVSIVIAILMTLLVTKIQDPADVDPQLLAPFIRRFVSNRKYPNQPRDGIIYAYETTTATINRRNAKEADQDAGA
ncbi:sodium-coupled monocarboxylate transporter 1-like [Atheta coriaria]|uniref:sodium-coupled monocarboxylate transporter 1-like n=1 Tax=Dalotia coriaria TaxID=877792 RepID=UPI0031F3C596